MKIHELLSDESKLCRREIAVDRNGFLINAESPEAVCWCIIGAAKKVGFKNITDHTPLYQELLLFGYFSIIDASEKMPFEQLHGILKKLDL